MPAAHPGAVHLLPVAVASPPPVQRPRRPAPPAEPAALPAPPAPRPAAQGLDGVAPAEAAPPSPEPDSVWAELPTYATRPPPAAELIFTYEREGEQGQARLVWQPTDTGFELTLDRQLPGRPPQRWHSRGGFDAAGLAPERHTVERRGRVQQATNFQREQGLLSYSSSSRVQDLVPGLQDRLSWMLQLSAIINADPLRFVPGQAVVLPVAAGPGRVQARRFVVQAQETSGWLHLQQQPVHAPELALALWLDPQRHFLPVRVRWQREGGEVVMELRLPAATAAP